MLLRNWEFDEESLDLFRYYRISSNAVYPYRFQGNTRLLRFAPRSEKHKPNLLAELEFIAYLRARGYGVLKSVLSQKGEELVEAHTPWGEYYASVFERVSGVQLNQTDLGDAILFSHGQALGKLHSLSSEYTPTHSKRWSYEDVLLWIKEVLDEYPHETPAKLEADRLLQEFAGFPVTPDNFGLIHYDFEFDNVFYDEATRTCNAIDFDDAMYHWYAMDIEQALDSLQDEVPPELYDHKKQVFLDGYATEYRLSDDDLSIMPACRRFAKLYGYVRLLRSTTERWENEPEWLSGLRSRLTRSMGETASGFGL